MFNLAILATEIMGLKDFNLIPGTLFEFNLAILANKTKELKDFNIVQDIQVILTHYKRLRRMN